MWESVNAAIELTSTVSDGAHKGDDGRVSEHLPKAVAREDLDVIVDDPFSGQSESIGAQVSRRFKTADDRCPQGQDHWAGNQKQYQEPIITKKSSIHN